MQSEETTKTIQEKEPEQAIKLQELRKYKREKKQEERKIEKHLVKFYAWQRYPGEPWKDFKRRFTSKKVWISDEEFK